MPVVQTASPRPARRLALPAARYPKPWRLLVVCLFWPAASILPMRFTLAPWKFLVDPPRHPVFGPFNTLNRKLTLHTPFFSLSFSALICRAFSCFALLRLLFAARPSPCRKKVWSPASSPCQIHRPSPIACTSHAQLPCHTRKCPGLASQLRALRQSSPIQSPALPYSCK